MTKRIAGPAVNPVPPGAPPPPRESLRKPFSGREGGPDSPDRRFAGVPPRPGPGFFFGQAPGTRRGPDSSPPLAWGDSVIRRPRALVANSFKPPRFCRGDVTVPGLGQRERALPRVVAQAAAGRGVAGEPSCPSLTRT